jgi:hypothetical protein
VDEDLSLRFKVRSTTPPEIWVEQNGTMLSPELVCLITSIDVMRLYINFQFS